MIFIDAKIIYSLTSAVLIKISPLQRILCMGRVHRYAKNKKNNGDRAFNISIISKYPKESEKKM